MRTRPICALACALLLLLPLELLAGPSVETRLASDGRPLVIAQRALGGVHPENSLAGIDFAISRGIEMVRIDVQRTRDEQYVVFHDPTLNRMTDVVTVYPDGPPSGPDRVARGGRDYVRDYTLEEINALRLKGETDGGVHRIPTLREALRLAEGRVLVLLGLKNYDARSLATLLTSGPTEGLMVFGILYEDPAPLRDVIELTGLPAAIALGESSDYLTDLDRLHAGLGPALSMVVARPGRVTPEFKERLQNLGIALCISGVRSNADTALAFDKDTVPWQAVLQIGADAYLTMLPLEVQELLGN